MTDTWTPPAFGAPTWLNIPVTDIDLAKTFYTAVFAWTFPPIPASESATDYAIFNFPSDSGQAPTGFMGSFERVDPAKHIRGANAIKPYFIVEEQEKAVEAIIKNGGKVLEGPVPEGDHGFITQCEDSEGNHFGFYVMKK
ncbi:hypothetical protein AJ79_08627 [Helicocarpus griseus UAMH5409]|uniref:VOC domain-containing protein n=1 Tax=Helicocarpus griseus UAMH5409 TaxID=1447875 RepID=A0A2B7WR55_9EURO|nr:hypothetical protein AJ79_08627 [Helicocarpus griseus UAMH5409]